MADSKEDLEPLGAIVETMGLEVADVEPEVTCEDLLVECSVVRFGLQEIIASIGFISLEGWPCALGDGGLVHHGGVLFLGVGFAFRMRLHLHVGVGRDEVIEFNAAIGQGFHALISLH